MIPAHRVQELLAADSVSTVEKTKLRRILVVFMGHASEFVAIAVQRASEITIFVAGMGIFLNPTLKKVYNQIKNAKIGYRLTGNGEIVFTLFDQRGISKQLNNILLLESDIPFNLPYPKKLFTSSIVLFCLSASGLALSSLLKKYGAYLHGMPKLVNVSLDAARKNVKLFWLAHKVLDAAAKGAAVYSASLFSLMEIADNIPGILSSFSFSSMMSKAESIPPLKLSADFEFTTAVDFSQLREGAKAGSQLLQDFDYYIAIALAIISLFLGFLALKSQQKYQAYADELTRKKKEPLAPILLQERVASNDLPSPSAANSYRMFRQALKSKTEMI